MTPAVSVIMAARNAEATIRTAIDSLLTQTMPDWELIIIDDASTDSTPGVASEIAQTDPRLRIVHQRIHIGPAAARNVALNRARGSFISFLDADDVLLPDALESLITCAQHNGRGAAYGGWRITKANGTPIDSQADIIPDLLMDLPRRLLGHTFPIHAQLISRTLLANHRFHEELPFGEDCELFTRLAAQGVCWHPLPHVVCEYRQHPKPRTLEHALAYRKVWEHGFAAARSAGWQERGIDVSHERERQTLDRKLFRFTHLLLLEDPSPAKNVAANVVSSVTASPRFTAEWAADIALTHIPLSDLANENAWLTNTDRYARAAIQWWNRCQAESWAPNGMTDEAIDKLLFIIINQHDVPGDMHVPTAVVNRLDLTQPIVLLGFGRNGKRIAHELKNRNVTYQVRDDALEPGAISHDNRIITVEPPAAPFDPCVQYVMTVFHDERYLQSLPNDAVSVRWRAVIDELSRPLRRGFDQALASAAHSHQPARTTLQHVGVA